MLKGKKLLTVILSVLFVLSMGTLVACGETDSGCNFATEWSSDATNHWYACTDSGCKEVDQLAEHVWDNGTVKVAATCTEAGTTEYKCKTCGYAKTEEVAALGHSFATTYTTDADGHWFACTRGCGAKGDYTEHAWNDGELLQEIVGTGKGEAIYACTVCGHDARNYIVNVTLVDMDGSLGGGFAEDKVVTVRVNGPKKISAVQERGPEYELVGYYTNPAYDTMVVDAEGNFVDCEYVEDGRWINEEGVELYAKWKRADKIYRVKFYVQNVNSDKYIFQPNQTITMKGYIGDMTAATAPAREGFTALPFEQVLIEEGGRTSVDIYYQRNVYNVTFVDNGAEEAPVTQKVKFGGKVAPVANGEKADFDFDGWYLDGEKFNFTLDNVPARDITLVAKYSIYLGSAGQYELYKGIANGAPVANADFTANVAGLGEYERVEVRANGTEFVLVEGEDYTLADGVFTLKADTIKKGVYGDIAIKFVTGEDFYYVNASIATKFIRSVEDLENLMIYGDVDENLNYGGYFMLANNIEVNGILANRVKGVNYTYIKANGDPQGGWHDSGLDEGFTGIFDGKGYTIFGLEATFAEGALFGNVAKGAVIKNLGIAEAKILPSGDVFMGLLANDFAGKLDNCYIDVAVANNSSAGCYIGALARSVAGATISNTVIKFNADKHSGDKFGYSYMINNWPGYATDKVVSNNVYMIVTDGVSIGGYASTNSDGVYWADISGITLYDYNEVIDGIIVYDYKYWNLNGDQPKFKSAGAADVGRDYYGEAYQDTPYEVYADVVDGELVGNDFVIDLTDTLGDFDASVVTSITFDAGANKVTTTNFSLDAGILTVNGVEIGTKIYGNVVVVLNTKDVNYKISSFNFVTKNISTKADLDNLMIYGGKDANLNYGGYFVMTDNVEVNGVLANRVSGTDYVAFNYKVSNMGYGFTGTFDGQGYTIKGLQINGTTGSLFGNVAGSAIVKNLGVLATFTQTASGNNYVFGAEFAGELKNSYVSVDFAAGNGGANYSVIAAQATNGVFNDVLIYANDANRSGGNLTLVGWMLNKWPNYWENNRVFSNLNAITTNTALKFGDYGAMRGASYYHGSYNSAKIYASTAIITDIAFADSTYWNFDGDQPKFATAGAVDKSVAYVGETYQSTPLYVYNSDNSTNDFVADLTGVLNAYDIDAADVLSIDIIGERGAKVSVETSALQAGILTVAGSKLGVSIYGNVTVVLNTALVNYKISSFKVITKVLTTPAEIVNIHQFGGATAGNYSYDGYYELGNNIDVAGMKITETYLKTAAQWEWDVDKWNQGFKGILDGKGYTIYNIPAFSCYSPGILGVIEQGAVVKNTAFIGKMDVEGAKALYTAMIALANRGTIENCYAEVTISKTAGSNGTARAGAIGRNYGTITDFVVKYDASIVTNAAHIAAIGKINGDATTKAYAYYKHAAGLTPATYAGVTNLAWNDKTTPIDVADKTYWNFDGDQPQFLSMGAANQEYDTGVTSFEAVSGLDGANVLYNDLVLNFGADIDLAKVTGVEISAANGDFAITDWSYNAGILTINGSALADVYGKAVVSIKTKNVNYNSNEIIIITKVIENQTDLENMPIYGGIDTASVGKTYGGYFVLADNLELTSALAKRVAGTDYRNGGATENAIEDRSGKVANDGMNGFTGIFDGQGYTISGLQVTKDNGGLFGNIATTGTVKNLGVIAKFVETGWGYVFGNQVTGVIDNVYVETSFSAGLGEGGYFAIARNVSSSKLSNIVIKYDTANAPAKNKATIAFMTGDWYGWNVHAGTMTNVYTISAGIASKGYTGTVAPTAEVGYSDGIANLTLADTTYWNLKGSQPMFATAGVPEVEVAYTGSTYQATPFTAYNADNSTNNFVVDLSATLAAAGIDMAKVTAIELTNGKSGVGLQLTDIVDGVLTVSGATFGVKMYDKVSVVLKTAETNYKISSFNVITKVINTKAELLALAAFGGATAAGESYDGYYVLGANIDLEGTLDTYFSAPNRTKLVPGEDKRDYKGFTGIFDGDGYTIYNMAPVYSKDSTLFGAIEAGAVVKNLGVVGWLKNYFSANATAFIAAYNAGLIENCYFEYVIGNGQSYTWGSNTGLVYVNDGDFKDVVIKIDATISGASDIFPTSYYGRDRGNYTNVNVYVNNPNNKVVTAPSSVTKRAYDDATVISMTNGACWNLTAQPVFLSAVDPANYTK